MGVLVKNVNTSVGLSLTTLKLVGFWAPDGLRRDEKLLYNCYAAFSFMFLLGIYIIIQVIDIFLIWGNLPLMTETAFLLFTTLAEAAKIFNILGRRQLIRTLIDDADRALSQVDSEESKKIVKSCDRGTSLQQTFFIALTAITGIGWATSAEQNQLPLRGWYPYDISKSPAYELTYVHQVTALFIAAFLNVAIDTLVTTLIAQCRCRLQLLSLSLKTLGQDLKVSEHKQMLTPKQEMLVWVRLRDCVYEHQLALDAVERLQDCFSVPTFAQFTVSLVIICVTAFQLVSQTGNLVRLLSMGTYLLNMCYQVFIYCYQGTQLSEEMNSSKDYQSAQYCTLGNLTLMESSEIARAAYECPWYTCSLRFRRALLLVMVRTRRVATLTAGGFTTLTLTTFMAIIKASYSLFTLLQQVEEKK